MGPRTIPAARFNYNETIARSLNEQLLLNLVRLRYRDTPLFIDVGTVAAQYTLSGRASASPTINIDGKEANEYGFGLGGSYSERPTITYVPLKGEEFAQRLLAPISPINLILLSQSGWSIERLLLCCVQRINELWNAPSATGPTPSYVPENTDFRKFAALLRKIQIARRMTLRLTYDQEQEQTSVYIPRALLDDPLGNDLRAIRELLKLSGEHDTFFLTAQKLTGLPNEIFMTGRSLLGVLFFLSQAVEVPPEHEDRGLVTVVKVPGEERFDWSSVTGDLMRISSQEERPTNAFIRINYRGHWFYVEDSDLHSKSTFNLLTYLFSLQAAGIEAVGPLLTLPVGR